MSDIIWNDTFSAWARYR